MANDVILDGTASYITSDQKSLALALLVEAAMPRVREKLIRSVLKGVKKCFQPPDYVVIECDGEDLLRAKKAWLTLRKQTWLDNLEHSDRSTGIRLGTDQKEGGDVYIGLYLANAVIEKIETQGLNDKLERLRQYNGGDSKNYPLKWDGRDDLGKLGDWSHGAFLEQVRSASDEIVGELTKRLKKWLDCPTVEAILSVVRRSHTE